MSVLQLPSAMGGLDLPDIKKYQLSAHLIYIANWIEDDASSIWLDIEKSLSNCPLKNLLFIDKLKCITKLCSNPVTFTTLLEHGGLHSIWKADQGLRRFSPQSLITLTFSQEPWTGLSNAGQLREFLPWVIFLLVLLS